MICPVANGKGSSKIFKSSTDGHVPLIERELEQVKSPEASGLAVLFLYFRHLSKVVIWHCKKLKCG